jgi:peptide/nickel transport system permease protein
VTAYLVRRLLLAVPTLAGIVLAVFLLMRIAPGDPTSAIGRLAHRRVPRAAAEAMRRTYGLDRPLPAQIADWFGRAARLDFGRSFQDHRPVARRIAEALPYTLLLNALALLLALAIAVPPGVARARRPGSAFDRFSSRAVFLLYSTPSFWMAMILATLFSARLEWLPLFGVASDPPPAGAAAALLDRLAHLALPLACLTYGTLAFLTRLVRSSVREELSREYVLAARARGLSESEALWRHAFRNALLPLVTVLGLVLPGLLSGSVIVEQIFAWPGLGRLYFDAVLARDYPVVLGLTFVTAVATLAATLAADLLYAVVDPRVRYG